MKKRRASSINENYFPRSFFIPLVIGLLLTLAVIASKGFSDSQDVRSKAIGPYADACTQNGFTCLPNATDCSGTGKTPQPYSCDTGYCCKIDPTPSLTPTISLYPTTTPACSPTCSTNGSCANGGTLLCDPVRKDWKCVTDLCALGSYDYNSCAAYGKGCYRKCNNEEISCRDYGTWSICQGNCAFPPTPTPDLTDETNWVEYCRGIPNRNCEKYTQCDLYQCEYYTVCGSTLVDECNVAG